MVWNYSTDDINWLEFSTDDINGVKFSIDDINWLECRSYRWMFC